MSEQDLIDEAIARFPETFGLRGFPGKQFRIGRRQSFISGGAVVLYTQVRSGDSWLDFAKGSERELKREVVR